MSSRIKLTHFRRETSESDWEWGGWFVVSEDDLERHTGTMLARWQELHPEGNMIILDLDGLLEGDDEYEPVEESEANSNQLGRGMEPGANG